MAEEGPGEGAHIDAADRVSRTRRCISCTGPGTSGTDDAEGRFRAILQRFDRVTVLHGHTHQVLTNRIGNIQFHGMLSDGVALALRATGAAGPDGFR